MLHTFARKTNLSDYNVDAKSSIVTFVHCVTEFKLNENHGKTPV